MIHFTNDNGTVEQFTIVLSQRDYTHLGQIKNISDLKFTAYMNAADELSFKINKCVDGIQEDLWDEIYDLRLVWVKELDEYFEINVEDVDSIFMSKIITAKSLCECELSQTYLHDLEINTENDINRDDYRPTRFYPTDTTLYDSLLLKVLEKVPAYTIGHVDTSLMALQRTFSISDTSLYDWLVGECSEAFNCLFTFNSKTRTINVYDLFSVCSHCGYRGAFNDFCPECDTRHEHPEYVQYPTYGEDTEIFVSSENLTDEINFQTDIDSVKNCFRLEAGDDDMTAAVVNINPNGSRYIYNFSQESLRDMSADLRNALETYNDKYYEYRVTKQYTTPSLPTVYFDLNGSKQNINFNNLISKYSSSYTTQYPTKSLTNIPNSFTGFAPLVSYIYEAYDLQSYLEHSMMPSSSPVDTSKTIAERERDILNTKPMGNYISLANYSSSTSLESVNNAIINISKVYIKSGYVKLKIKESSYTYGVDEGSWSGIITVTSYSDDEDVLDTNRLTFAINGDYGTFMEQKIAKQIENSTPKEEDNVYDVLKNTPAGFRTNIQLYSLERLKSFRDAIDAAMSVLQQAGCGADSSDATKHQIYTNVYTPYFQKYGYACDEIDRRSHSIKVVELTIDTLSKFKADIQAQLDIKTNLGTQLYNTFTTYLREDTYNNSNYISDGLDTGDLFDKAQEFTQAASDELFKSSMYQHSLTSNLNNLLLIPEFKGIINKFELGNWIRVGMNDGKDIYRLRLISYSIEFEDLGHLNTEFSDVTKTADGLNDINSILKQASSMATSYNATTKQVDAGEVAKNYIDEWVKKGLDSALTRVNNNVNEEITITSAGIVGREYDDINDTYGEEQIRITHNVLCFTDDNWSSVKTALGKFTFTHHTPKSQSTTPVTEEKYGLVAEAVLAGYIVGSHMESGDIIASYLQNVGNTNYIDLSINGSSTSDFIHTSNFQVKGNGTITSTSGRIQTSDTAKYLDLGATSGNYLYLGSKFYVTTGGVLNCSGATVSGAITATSLSLGSNVSIPNNKLATQNVYVSSSNNSVTIGTGANPSTSTSGHVFKVDTNGLLTASNAALSGTIYATSGVIGGWNINTSYGSGSSEYTLSCLRYGNIGSNNSIWLIPQTSSPSATFGNRTGSDWMFTVGKNFGITRQGVLYLSSGKIYNGTYNFLNLSGDGDYGFCLGTSNEDKVAIGSSAQGYRLQTKRIDMNIDSSSTPTITMIGGNINCTGGTVTALHHETSSDIRLKHNINDLKLRESIKIINSFIPKTFVFNKCNKISCGVIAQELMNELIKNNIGIDINNNPFIHKDESGYYSVDYVAFIPHIINLLKSQQTEIENLKGQLK